MPASPLASAEISIPTDRIAREFSRSAQPGFYGQTEIRIVLLPKALEGVVFIVAHQRKVRSSDASEQLSAMTHDTERELAVLKVIADISGKMHLRAAVVKIVGHFADGHLQSCDIVDESRAQ